MGITLDYLNNKKELLDRIKSDTGSELTDSIIKYLFEDNYYNVTVNIKEVLRYNKVCNILNIDEINFYESLLLFDGLSDKIKREFFEHYKDYDLHTKFYLDIRVLRDDAIIHINDDLYKLCECDKTKKFISIYPDVFIYDLRDKDFYMLVRCSDSPFDGMSNYVKNSYSLINQNNTIVYYRGSFIYGYNSLDKNYVLHMYEDDSMSHKLYEDEHSTGSRFVNRIMTSKELVENSSNYSEIEILNERVDIELYKVKTPDFIICFNRIDDVSVSEAKRLNIPIVLINYHEPSDEIKFLTRNNDLKLYK